MDNVDRNSYAAALSEGAAERRGDGAFSVVQTDWIGASPITSSQPSQTYPQGDETRPFSFADFERKTANFLDAVRQKARQIADETQMEILAVREEAERRIQARREELDAMERELTERRQALEAAEADLTRRRDELERDAFEAARREGRAKGEAEGLELGRAEAEREIIVRAEEKSREFCDAAIIPIRKLIDEMAGARSSLLKNWQENALQIAAVIAYQTIMRDPATARLASLDLLREALDLAMNCAALKIKMNPKDVETLSPQIQTIIEEAGALTTAEVVADPKISSGGCLVESSLGVIDERLESRLQRIVSELSD